MDSLQDQLEQAMRDASPLVHFRDAMAHRLAEGASRNQLVEELEDLRATVDDQREDLIFEILDFIVGWCHPDMRL
ncbi:hypothetical protein ACQ859_23085 [Roseateles chitinivorans]|uniref:hypothetical protein n=1 Tax=Roseateles chitinivorans TaxID=2917965 RepID=UPI003D66584C